MSESTSQSREHLSGSPEREHNLTKHRPNPPDQLIGLSEFPKRIDLGGYEWNSARPNQLVRAVPQTLSHTIAAEDQQDGTGNNWHGITHSRSLTLCPPCRPLGARAALSQAPPPRPPLSQAGKRLHQSAVLHPMISSYVRAQIRAWLAA